MIQSESVWSGFTLSSHRTIKCCVFFLRKYRMRFASSMSIFETQNNKATRHISARVCMNQMPLCRQTTKNKARYEKMHWIGDDCMLGNHLQKFSCLFFTFAVCVFFPHLFRRSVFSSFCHPISSCIYKQLVNKILSDAIYLIFTCTIRFFCSFLFTFPVPPVHSHSFRQSVELFHNGECGVIIITCKSLCDAFFHHFLCSVSCYSEC